MIRLVLTPPPGHRSQTGNDVTVRMLDDKEAPLAGYPDITFGIKTYQRIRTTGSDVGENILKSANLFLDTLAFDEQIALYQMYQEAHHLESDINFDNYRERIGQLRALASALFISLKLPERLIAFCQLPMFEYPETENAGDLHYHTAAQTFLRHHIIDVTALSILSKLMVPIWGNIPAKEPARAGEETRRLSVTQREYDALTIIEPVLEDGAFESIYDKIMFWIAGISDQHRTRNDAKQSGPASSSFIITHNGMDEKMFNMILMGVIITKKLAMYDGLQRNDDRPTQAIAYMFGSATSTVMTKIKSMRGTMNTMPQHELNQSRDSEENSSIIDHVSRTSSRSIDIPVATRVWMEMYGIPQMLQEYDIPLQVYTDAVAYYAKNPFEVDDLLQCVMSSFLAKRIGGSKCINYLTPDLYQRAVVILQIYLIREGFTNLAALIVSTTGTEQLEGVTPILHRQIEAANGAEYLLCQNLFRGHMEKYMRNVGRGASAKKAKQKEILNFETLIERLQIWVTHFDHTDNMAPSLWKFTGENEYPVTGSPCRIDANIIRDLCKYILLRHDVPAS